MTTWFFDTFNSISPITWDLVGVHKNESDIRYQRLKYEYVSNHEYFSICHGSEWSPVKFQSDDVIMGSTGVE